MKLQDVAGRSADGQGQKKGNRARGRALRWLPLALALAVGCGGATSQPARHGGATAQGQGGGANDAGGTPSGDEGWEKIREADGIVAYRKEIEGSPIVAFRGEGDIEAPIRTVATVLMDLEHNPEWVDRVIEGRVIERRSDKEHLTYTHVGAPWPVSDRDFLNQVDIEFAAPTRIKFNLHSVDDPKGPKTSHVHGKLHHSSFELTAIDKNRTRVLCEIHADPMGSLPKFVVNLFQKSWAFNTLTNLRKQVKKPEVLTRTPDIGAILARQGFE